MKAIVTYHSIDDSGSVISLAPPRWWEHAAWYASGAVRVVPLAALPEAAGRDAVALTFDDGFGNFATHAWPPLRERRVPVTLFVVSEHAGRTNAWGGRDSPGIPTLPLLDWDALGRLAEEGVELGAHSRTHADLTRLPDAALREELEGAAEAIAARTGRRPSAFAYPYGAVNPRVAAAAGAVYAHACTTEFRPLGTAERPHALPRLDAYYLRSGGRLSTWGTAGFRRYLWVRGAARRARRALARVAGGGSAE